MEVWSWFTRNIFTDPAIFMALMILVGLLLSRKKFYEALAGALKGYIGYSVFSLASGGMTGTFRPILLGLKDRFNLSATISDPYFGMGTLQSSIMPDLGRSMSITALVMLFGFLVSILLALLGKITKIRTLNVAGNCLNAFAMVNTCTIALCCPSLSDTELIIYGSIFTALCCSVYSNLTVEAAQSVTDGAGMAVGHSQNIMDCFAHWLGEKFSIKARAKGKEIKKYEDMNLPGWLSIFDDMYVAAAIVMFIIFGIMLLALGKDYMMTQDATLTETTDWNMYIFKTTMKFPIYMVMLMTGLRMFVAELTVAFNAISEKILRGTLPAVDCAVFYGFVPSGTTITAGFIIGSLTMLASTFIGVVLNLPFILIMGFIPMFFDNATVAIFAHNKGGIKAQILCNILTGMIDVLIGGISCYIVGYTAYGGAGMNIDNSVTYWLWGLLMQNGGRVGLIIMFIILLAIPQIQYRVCKDTYWLASTDWEKYKEVHEEKVDQQVEKLKAKLAA
ncbi:PTS ascorbate transporter subunit IIC [Coriobacteriales bacterium OH1046]|nr:PTS ascorbate transporter subunit IIC [Coriobacteriales bacterium OH1046]